MAVGRKRSAWKDALNPVLGLSAFFLRWEGTVRVFGTNEFVAKS
jgi:hypothetical protein